MPAAIAYDRNYCDQHGKCKTLTFKPINIAIEDMQIHSKWNILGQTHAEPMQSEKLRPIDRGVHFTFAWLGLQPGSEVYSVNKKL